MKFVTPVSMPCRPEQFEEDLRTPLEELGYKIRGLSWAAPTLYFIVNNVGTDMGYVSNISGDNCLSHDRYYIKEYNPELFLALAAMTDDNERVFGEYFTLVDNNMFIGEGKLYKKFDGYISCDGIIKINITEENFKEFLRKATKEEIINNFKQTSMNVVSIKKTDFKKLYDIACSGWKTNFDDYLKPFMFSDSIDFKQDFINQMRKACTTDQLPVFNELFGELDKNAFISEASPDFLEDISEELFGHSDIMQIAYSAANGINRPDLNGKSIYFKSSVELVLHKTNSGGTVVEIKNR